MSAETETSQAGSSYNECHANQGSDALIEQHTTLQQNSSEPGFENGPELDMQDLTVNSGPGATAQAAGSTRRPSIQLAPLVPAELLLKAAAKQGHRIPRDSDAQRKQLGKLTHLHINGLQLQELHSLRLCPRLQVLYLYDNQLTSISNIAASRLLTHIYLQNNQLQQLAGLQDLALLQKLYLQNNCLSLVDNLTAASRLEELHVSDQQPQQNQQQEPVLLQQCSGTGSKSSAVPAAQQAAAGTCTLDGLMFQPESLQAISGSLRVLAASSCGLTDVSQFAVLQNLRMLDLSRNNISRLDSLQPLLQALQQLRVLDIRHNPCVQHEHKYRDYVILLAADTLLTLDGEDIPASHRTFLLGLHLNKLRAQGKIEQQQQQGQQQGQQLVSKRLDCSTLPAAAGGGKLGAAGKPTGAIVGLSGSSITLHALKAPAVRPTAAGGFNASSARIAAALAGPSHPTGSGHPCQEL